MEENQNRELTSEDLEEISRLEFQKECKEVYNERPRWHRIMAWVLLAILLIGIGCFCYWEMLPQL